MDKAILKKFAIESRKDLMQKIESKIKLFYVDETFSKQQNGDVYVLSNEKHTLSLSKEEYEKRELLIKRINELGVEQVIEEAAYTWFNRIVAIRYMEINDYLPLTKDNQSLGIRVLSSKDNTPDPEIMKFTNLTNPELDIDFKKEKYIELKDDAEKYKYVLLLVCKKLGKVIPQVFDGITDYIDILVPDNLLNDSGFINKIINELPVNNFNRVEIIGWLYQYYNSEEKDKVMASTSSKKNYLKKEIPYVTQIFTPDWIVKYMVDNSLGRYCLENKIVDKSELKEILSYYDNNNICVKNEGKHIEEIKFIDPCCGSGHILVYAFELFYNIYLKIGYNKNDIPQLILKNNIYGLDIDDRAGQLSILAVLLRAREIDKNIFNKDIIKNINITSIQESNKCNNLILEDLSDNCKEIAEYLIKKFFDAKEIGSLLEIDDLNYESLENEIDGINNIFGYELKAKLKPIIKCAKILSQKYDIAVTNPPYLGNAYMSSSLYKYVEKEYSSSKIDLFSSFIEKESRLTKKDGYYSAIVLPSFLFLKSFSKLRKFIIDKQQIISLLHMGRGIFGVDFGSTAFVIKNDYKKDYIGKYFKLYSKTFQYIDVNDIEKIYLDSIANDKYMFDFANYNTKNCSKSNFEKIVYYNIQENFNKIKENPISYWITTDEFVMFNNNKKLGDIYEIRGGMTTSNTELFLKYWWEVDFNKIGFNYNKDNCKDSGYKWFPYNKGGAYRKWYGNREYVINWENDGKDVKEYKLLQREKDPKFNVALAGLESMFKEQLSWSLVSAGKFSARFYEEGFLFDVSGCCVLPTINDDKKYTLAFMNSNIAERYLKAFNPTMNTTPGDVKGLCLLVNEYEKEMVEELCDSNIELSKKDWDISENSWDFKKNILVEENNSIEKIYNNLEKKIIEDRNKLKENEEEINKYFINLYKLNDLITYQVEEDDITLRNADKIRDVKSLISYAVGCMFGRYSLDKEGLIFAGGKYDESNYKTFKVDTDNIIPITDEAYFADDIVARFKDFIEVVYGKETLNANLDFIAETLGKKGTETSEETIRRYFLNDFYSDHIKMYQKKPIYWLFDSGKKNGFKALIYMHRYNENTVPKVRLDYLHRVQNTYDKLLADVNYRLTTELSVSDKKIAQNRQADLNAKLQEITAYDEKIAHIANQRISIDLDDGVTANYDKFKDILAKIK